MTQMKRQHQSIQSLLYNDESINQQQIASLQMQKKQQ